MYVKQHGYKYIAYSIFEVGQLVPSVFGLVGSIDNYMSSNRIYEDHGCFYQVLDRWNPGVELGVCVEFLVGSSSLE
ncbi:hypothetical protein RCL_jg13955.t1 [Rhizophagus clarus]|uniref:Uncharacterized protein n=1 Tax=Rhizophagus clarus TaxID=94130 RepID=A0A8H3QTU6_9GLOM|nr:hypothetical protein RCL_jg13955.t1 [Rhizophagus clarus]